MAKLLGTIRGHRFITMFHLTALVHHLIVWYYATFVVDFATFMHQYQYLHIMATFSSRFFTSWNFGMQGYYFMLCLVYDVLQMTDPNIFLGAKKSITQLRNYTFRTFTFPLAFTVTLIFWGLFSLDRTLIFPPEAELVVPSWLNHGMHTNISILVLVEMATTYHGYSQKRSRLPAIIGITLIAVLYAITYFGTYFQHGVWLYPIFGFIQWSQRILLMSFIYLVSLIFYLCGEGLSSKLWGEPNEQFTKQKTT